MKKVTVYTSTTCPYCQMAKEYLQEREIPFDEKNVQTDKEARSELMAMGYTGCLLYTSPSPRDCS